MKKIDLGQAISIIANVGVILDIGFLAIEISQNTDALTAQARYMLRSPSESAAQNVTFVQ